jgi:hypothetical protein
MVFGRAVDEIADGATAIPGLDGGLIPGNYLKLVPAMGNKDNGSHRTDQR